MWYVVTAGHCNNVSNNFWHDSVPIGAADFNTIVNLWSPASDALRVPHQKNTSYMNTIRYAAAMPAYVISATKAESYQHVGDSVCKSGLGMTTFGTKCGQITALWGTWQANGKTIFGRVTDVDVSGGDSGAPFYYANALMGLGAAGNTQSSIYSLATWAEDELSVTFCHTGSCL